MSMHPTRRMAVAHDEIASQVLEGEAIIINLATGLYYSLDGSGALVWSMLQRGATVVDMTAALARAYGIAAERARADVEALLADMEAESLVAEKAAPPHALEPAAEPAAPRRAYAAPHLQRYSDMERFFALDPPLPVLDDESEKPS